MRREQLYGLFERTESGGWRRLYLSAAFIKRRAVVCFQNQLLASSLSGGSVPERRLLPVGHRLW
jgi:hypothetical protein